MRMIKHRIVEIVNYSMVELYRIMDGKVLKILKKLCNHCIFLNRNWRDLVWDYRDGDIHG